MIDPITLAVGYFLWALQEEAPLQGISQLEHEILEGEICCPDCGELCHLGAACCEKCEARLSGMMEIFDGIAKELGD